MLAALPLNARRLLVSVLLPLAGLVTSAAAVPAAAQPPTKAGISFFEQKIRPVLVKHCYKCHSGQAKKLQGKFRLDSRDLIRKGGETGPAVVAGKPASSLLLDAIRYESLEMPPDGKLPARVIADFETWIRMGAPDPRDKAPVGKSGKQQGMSFKAARDWWSYQPVAPGKLPATKRGNWARRRLDHFVLARLEEHGLEPSPAADRRTLLRRLKLDLLGLPPTEKDIAEFEADKRPDATARLVDRLLASRHYGERWGRHWLDVARWAEDNPTSVFNRLMDKVTLEPTAGPNPTDIRRKRVLDAVSEELNIAPAARKLASNSGLNLPIFSVGR